jgi:hypothetical protein
MSLPLYTGPVCARLLTTSVASASPISLLLSPDGLEYARPWVTLMNEAQIGRRLCRILKDFLDQAEARSRARRNRLQRVTDASQIDQQDRDVRFLLRLSGSNLLMSAPYTLFAGTIHFGATTNFGKVMSTSPHTDLCVGDNSVSVGAFAA